MSAPKFLSDRTLKAAGSHADAPDRKAHRVEHQTPEWAKALMQKMTGVEGKVDGMSEKVEEAVKVATEAKASVETLRGEVVVEAGSIKQHIQMQKKRQTEWQQMIEGKVAWQRKQSCTKRCKIRSR